jgi:uncharacterized protein YbjT (DUF2867 family)
MKIVVIGGTGLVGSKLVERLRSDGHEPLAAPPDSLEGAQVVVDVSNTSTADLLTAEATARVAHHVALSVDGADRLQEEVVKAGPVPYTILRAAQLFEFVGRIADSSTDGDIVRLPPTLIQPVAADDVASALADLALGSPLNDTVELAGPEAFRLDELARRVLEATGDSRRVTTDVHARCFGAEVDGRPLIPAEDARIASTRFEDWIGESS